MSKKYDTIIAGAGPGGATAAYFFGEVGQRVLVKGSIGENNA